jgi:hypothetical protein
MFSCPYIDISVEGFLWCLRTNSALWTNIPAEPKAGSKILPLNGLMTSSNLRLEAKRIAGLF